MGTFRYAGYSVTGSTKDCDSFSEGSTPSILTNGVSPPLSETLGKPILHR